MTDKHPFKVIEGTPPPDTPKQHVIDRVKASRPSYTVSCHRCGGMEVIETKIGVMIKDGKPSGGTKQLLCALCFMKGERVVIG